MSSFNFLAAINGEPIYFDGIRIYPIWIPSFQQWEFDKTYYNKDKTPFTTDPPKKKVKKIVKVRLYKNHYGNIMATTVMNEFPIVSILKDFETEIEVEE